MNSRLLESVAGEYGTPVYVYDEAKIISQYNRLKNAFGKQEVKLHYAMKALSNINVLKTLKEQGAGLDAVSIEEVHLGIRAGFEPEEIMYTPNGVAFSEIEEAVALGVMINIDNLSVLEHFGMVFGGLVPVCIRINPHILAGGHANISVGHIDSKFGISIHQLRHIQRIVEHYKLHIVGLHMHTGSDIVDADVFLQGADLLYQAAGYFPELKFMDFGSGFKVAYKEGDFVTPIEEIGTKIGESFQNFCKEYGRELELWFEPGKFLVSESGVLLVSVNVVKQTTSTVFLGVNSGQNHLIRPMFYNAYHRIENISNPAGQKKLYSVVGYICETDTFGYDRPISEAKVGDVLGIYNAGAYGFSMSNQYNSRLRPAEVYIRDGVPHLIRKRETLDDVIRNEIDLTLSAEYVAKMTE
ncbi:diaminopimelate decarboxylase [uncultured Fluviicola sp.]|uniref:diaminopimelate decarboxylase n=1 Tax=uncultured Fluviicola sp. TaxID=463303 RepID=UPI0025D17852|nr:diaminopimelate decarboxylase [uncultured Fluviicola sp.]